LKELLKMTNITISISWYQELVGLVPMMNPYFYTEDGTSKVEVDVHEPTFNKVSKELGWM
jgi:hypothetical protein